MDLNKAMIIGRLTRDPETRTTASGQTVTSFSIATNFQWKGKDGNAQKQVEYHNIVAWRKLAEICAQYLKKGKQVYVEGRLQTRSWDAQDGTKKNRTEIVADNVIMLGDKGSAGSSEPSHTGGGIPEIQVDEPVTPASSDDAKEINVDDIPF